MENIIMKNLKIFFIIIILISSPVFADGFIIIDRPPRQMNPFPLEVAYHNVNTVIDGQIATTSIDQAFFNPSDFNLEGYYLFPIPAGAVIKEFSMIINGKETSAELLDALKARQLYEDIVRRVRDPALLEYSDRGVFKVRIFPIEPHSKKEVKISYREVLNKENNEYEYIYPLNTEKFSAKPLEQVSINVKIKLNEKINNIYCPTHETDIRRSNDYNASISYEEENVTPNIDFKLYFTANTNKVGISLLSYKEHGEDGFFFLNLTPSLDFKQSETDNKDITFVLDVSGSMSGDKLKQAKKALNFCIENLNSGDMFEIIKFSTEAYSLFNKLTLYDEHSKNKALQFIKGLKPIGGTNIEDALALALKNSGNRKHPHMIVFITDGMPTIGETDEVRLVEKVKNSNDDKTRIFTFGIGTDINTHLLDKITEITRASRTYISPEEDIEIKVSQFYNKVQSPALTDISLDFSGMKTYQIYPKNLPDLFYGSGLTIFGRYDGDGEREIKLTGLFKGQKKEFSYRGMFVDDDNENDFIPPLWAARRVGDLLDMLRLKGENKELVEEVTDLARTYGIVTPYTSYLIIEDETRLRPVVEEFQTLSNAAPDALDLRDQNKADYEAMKQKSGNEGVRTSKEFDALTNATSIGQTQQGSDRMKYQGNNGETKNLLQQVQNINGRAFYQSGKYWVDSQLQNKKSKQTVKIQFASKEYFDLFNKKKEAAKYLALGQNVRFMLDDTFYEIYE